MEPNHPHRHSPGAVRQLRSAQCAVFWNLPHSRHHLLQSVSPSYWRKNRFLDTVIIQETGLFGLRSHYGVKLRIVIVRDAVTGLHFLSKVNSSALSEAVMVSGVSGDERRLQSCRKCVWFLVKHFSLSPFLGCSQV